MWQSVDLCTSLPVSLVSFPFPSFSSDRRDESWVCCTPNTCRHKFKACKHAGCSGVTLSLNQSLSSMHGWKYRPTLRMYKLVILFHTSDGQRWTQDAAQLKDQSALDGWERWQQTRGSHTLTHIYTLLTKRARVRADGLWAVCQLVCQLITWN